MSSAAGGTISGGTLRGTPKRGGIPFTEQSPGGSNIPRPTGGIHDQKPSEAGSGVSASRQKQTKRDEVRDRAYPFGHRILTTPGYSSQAGERSLQKEASIWPQSTHPESTPWHRPLPEAEPGSADQALDDRLGSSPAHGRQARRLRSRN